MAIAEASFEQPKTQSWPFFNDLNEFSVYFRSPECFCLFVFHFVRDCSFMLNWKDLYNNSSDGFFAAHFATANLCLWLGFVCRHTTVHGMNFVKVWQQLDLWMKSLKYMRPTYYQFSGNALWFQISWWLIVSLLKLQSFQVINSSFLPVAFFKKEVLFIFVDLISGPWLQVESTSSLD